MIRKIAAFLSQLLTSHWTGYVKIHFHDGHIKKIEKGEIVSL